MTRLCCFLRGGHRWNKHGEFPYGWVECRRCGHRA